MSRWGQLFGRRERMMEDLDRDIRDYIARETQDNIERGMAPEEARYAALRKFGNVTRVKEDTWEVWGFVWLEQLWQDIRFGLRTLAKNPGFTAVVAGLLALGIGATTVIFSLFDAVFLRQLPVRHPAELVRMVQHILKTGPHPSNFSFTYDKALQDHATTLAATFAETGRDFHFTMSDPEPAEEITLRAVTPNYFETLGVQALYGWVLLPGDEDEKPGTPAAVLSYGFWQRRFGGNPSVVNGQTILVNGYRFAIVGVMPRDFNGLTVETAPDIRIPLRAFSTMAKIPRDLMWFELAGRLKPGVTLLQAEAECQVLWRSTMEDYYLHVGKLPPKTASSLLARGMLLEPVARGVSILRERYGDVFKLLMASVALLLLIVTTNVAGLLLERAAARQEQTAVRQAVGATRFRLVRQMLAENLLLTALGATAGLVVAAVGMPLATRIIPPIRLYPSPFLESVSIDVGINWRIFLFLLVLSLVTMILFSLSPALAVSRSSLESLLRATRSTTGARGRQALIALQIALSTLLLVTAGLFVRTFRQLQRVDPGLDVNHIATFTLNLDGYKGNTAAFVKAFTDRVRAIPGTVSVGVSSLGVMKGVVMAMTVAPPGQRLTQADFLNTAFDAVSPEYFDTMGMHIVSGRGFVPSDVQKPKQAGPVRIVVNQSFVRRFFPNTQPLGKLLGQGAPGEVTSGTFEIIGVVSDSKYRSLRAPLVPVIYACRTDFSEFVLNVRTRMAPKAIIAPVRKTLASLDPGLPFLEVHTLAEETDNSMAAERITATVASLFGGLAALLVGMGIYGLLAYVVTQRRREIGIRMALGADRGDVLKLIVGQGFKLASIGLGIGILGSLASTRFLASLLYGVKPADPLTFITVPLLLIALALLASYLPARRATKVDPMVALRYE